MYIGHLEEQHICQLNHALTISVRMIEETSEDLIMCICLACVNKTSMTQAPIVCAGAILDGEKGYLRAIDLLHWMKPETTD